MADKPVSLAERISACCPCQYSDSGPCCKACPCTGLGEPIEGPCENPLHALEAEAKELDMQILMREGVLSMTVARLGGTVEGRPTHRDNFLQRVDELREAEARVEALVEVLRSAPDPINPPAPFFTPQEQLAKVAKAYSAYVSWHQTRRAAALAERKP